MPLGRDIQPDGTSNRSQAVSPKTEAFSPSFVPPRKRGGRGGPFSVVCCQSTLQKLLIKRMEFLETFPIPHWLSPVRFKSGPVETFIQGKMNDQDRKFCSRQND